MAQTWYAIKKEDSSAEVSIYDEIGGWGVGAKQFLSDISGLKGKELHVRINSPGGSVVEGTAIYNALRRHVGGVIVHIDALAASMASVIAMAGDQVLIADNALMMVHNPWTITAGDSEDLRKEADLLDKLKSTLVSAYTRKTGMDSEKVQELMNSETWMDSLDAVAFGFADAIEGGIEASAKVTPEELRGRFDKFAKANMSEASETIEEPIVDPVIEPAIDPITEPVVEPVIAEPVAKIDTAALVAKVQDMQAQISILSTRAEVAETALAQLERSLGVASAVTVPIVEPVKSTPTASIVDQFNAITDPEAKTAFYKKHAAELKKFINKAPAKTEQP